MIRSDAYPYELKTMLSEGKAKVGLDKALEEVLTKWPAYKTRLTRANAQACVTTFRKVHALRSDLLCPIDKLEPRMRNVVLNTADRLRTQQKRMSAIVKTLREKYAGVLIPEPRELEKLLAEQFPTKATKKRAAPEPKTVPQHNVVPTKSSSNGHCQLIIKGLEVSFDASITKEAAVNIIKAVWGVA